MTRSAEEIEASRLRWHTCSKCGCDYKEHDFSLQRENHIVHRSSSGWHCVDCDARGDCACSMTEQAGTEATPGP